MKITVAIPVGPFEPNQRWLDECLESVETQTRQPDEILLIDDMADLEVTELRRHWVNPIRIWRAPWRLGVAHAFNAGVALSRGDAVFMLGSDDTLAPDCLAECERAWERDREDGNDPRTGYFWVGVHYLDDREDPDQFLPCNAAMVSRALWEQCGGFPIETAMGAPDSALVSIMMVHPEAGRLVTVNRGRTLYNYRPHGETDTAGRSPWQGAILQARDILTKDWKVPDWGRFS